MASHFAALLAALLCLLSSAATASTQINYSQARATWYGAKTGAGPADNGGACGFKNVNLPPFSSMTAGGSLPIFKGGRGCGSCYKVRCTNNTACSGNPETVIITDKTNNRIAGAYHFGLSGSAFGAMAKPGQEDKLRQAGIIDIQYTRVPCEYPGLKIAFHVENGSNPEYFAVLVQYVAGDGDVAGLELMESSKTPTSKWAQMRESWGAIWRLDSNRTLQAPFSLRITTESGKKLVADKVIPANWRANTLYRSIVQFS